MLNGGHGVAAHTHDRIIQIIDELGYVPNPSARNLRGQHRAICWGVVIVGDDPRHLPILRNLSTQAREADTALLVETADDTDHVATALARLRQHHAQPLWISDGIAVRPA